MPQGKWFRIAYGIILVLLIIFLSMKVSFLFTPIVIFFQTIFIPILISGILYYLSRPIVRLLSRKMPRFAAIGILFLSAIIMVALLILLIGPELQRQISSFIKNIPFFITESTRLFTELQSNEWFMRFQESADFSLDEWIKRIASFVNDLVGVIGASITSIVGVVANIVLLVMLVPFMLFYMLKDGEKGSNQLLKLLSAKHREEGRKILANMDIALSSYIQGQIIVSVCVGVMVYIGYLLIGLEYSLVLALIALFTNFIPFIGPWLGILPAVIVGFLDSPFTALLVAIVVTVAQQIESNLISPQIMGKKLDIHPLTIILLILVAGKFVGFIGLLVAVPTYAVVKVIVVHMYRLFQLNRQNAGESEPISLKK